MSEVAVALQAVSSIAQGVAQYRAAEAQSEAAKAQAAALEYNADVSAKEAEAVRQRFSYEAALIRQAGARMLSEQRAAYASRGYATTTGTPLHMVAETARKIETDKMMKLYQGDVEARKQYSAAALEKTKAQSLRSTAGYYTDVGRTGSLLTMTTGLGQAYMTGIDLGLFENPFKSEVKNKEQDKRGGVVITPTFPVYEPPTLISGKQK